MGFLGVAFETTIVLRSQRAHLATLTASSRPNSLETSWDSYSDSTRRRQPPPRRSTYYPAPAPSSSASQQVFAPRHSSASLPGASVFGLRSSRAESAWASWRRPSPGLTWVPRRRSRCPTGRNEASGTAFGRGTTASVGRRMSSWLCSLLCNLGGVLMNVIFTRL